MKIASPGPVPKEALRFFRNKGLKVGFSYLDVWREEHTFSFTVAKAMEVDVLETIRAEVDRAIADGITLAQFRKELEPMLVRQGWWGKREMEDPYTGQVKTVQLGSPRRLKTIYDVNCRTSRAAGQWDRIQRTKKSLKYLLYEIGPSERHRPEHVSWNGTLLPADDPWWQAHFTPNGYGCKCRVRQVGETEAGRLKEKGVLAPDRKQILDKETGLPTGHVEKRYVPVRTTAPPVRMKEWVNKRTGEVLDVPEGIDPGFDSNPGSERRKAMDRFMAGKLKAADPAIAEAARKDLAEYRKGEKS